MPQVLRLQFNSKVGDMYPALDIPLCSISLEFNIRHALSYFANQRCCDSIIATLAIKKSEIENKPSKIECDATETTTLNMASDNDYCCVPQCNSWAKRDTERKLNFRRYHEGNARQVYTENEIGNHVGEEKLGS
nr:unnamed protein product [Callosobruchus analis]